MRRFGLVLVVALAFGTVGYKALMLGASAAAAEPSKKAPRVLLFADLREAEESCGCGEIIRAVRAAAARGVPTRENDDALAKQHHVTVQPSVIILDASGHETGRFEGESAETVKRLKAALDKIPVEKK